MSGGRPGHSLNDALGGLGGLGGQALGNALGLYQQSAQMSPQQAADWRMQQHMDALQARNLADELARHNQAVIPKKPKKERRSFRQQLQKETDEWLKNVQL